MMLSGSAAWYARAGGNMTVMGAVLGILSIAIVGRWLLMGGDDQAPDVTRKPH